MPVFTATTTSFTVPSYTRLAGGVKVKSSLSVISDMINPQLSERSTADV